MNYIIEWDENIIHMLNNSKTLGKSSWGPLPRWGIANVVTTSKPQYIYIKGATQREDMFFKGNYHYSPPMIDREILEYGDKTSIKNCIKAKRLFILSSKVTLEAIEAIIDMERNERENAVVPEIVKPFITKLDWNKILYKNEKKTI